MSVLRLSSERMVFKTKEETSMRTATAECSLWLAPR